MITINDKKEWKQYKVKELFEIEKCKCSNASALSKNTNNSSIPYIGATNRNNGTMYFVERNEAMITKGNCIVFICDGQGSVGYSLYKKEDFIGSTTLKIGRNQNLNQYNGLFIVAALNKNKELYSYGYKRTENRLKNEVIYLPANELGLPDYKYMESCIKNKFKSKINTCKAYIEKNYAMLDGDIEIKN